MTGLTSLLQSVFAATRQGAACAMLVLALAVQALVPSGYMVGSSERDGTIAITLCTSEGMIAAFLDANGQITETKPGMLNSEPEAPVPDTDDTSSPCAFVVHATAGLAPQQAALHLPRPIFYALVQPRLIEMLGPGRGLAAPPPPKTGPPIQA